MNLFVLNLFPDGLRGCLKGVIKGLGAQDKIVSTHLIAQVPLICILFYMFAFYFNMKMEGIWIGKTFVEFFILFNYLRVIHYIDWTKLAKDATTR